MKKIHIPFHELKFTFIRSSGPGGQNVNKVATAVQLRFNVMHSTSLTETVRHRLMKIAHNQIAGTGDLLIKASQFRTQERNKSAALERLYRLIERATLTPKKRKATRPTHASKEERIAKKKKRGKAKLLRQHQFHSDY